MQDQAEMKCYAAAATLKSPSPHRHARTQGDPFLLHSAVRILSEAAQKAPEDPKEAA
jgi:hypothetical protein